MNKDLYALCLLLLIGANVSAQFNPATTSYMEGVTSAAQADLDNDGFVDVLVGTRKGIFLLKNHYGNVHAEAPSKLNWNDEVVLPFDVDGDGYADILSGSSIKNGIRWIHNQGNGSFSNEKLLRSTGFVKHLVACDMDSDGDLDLVANTTDKGILLYRNNGNSAFDKERLLSKQTASKAPQLIDLDGDQDLDLFWNNGSNAFWSENVDGRGIMSNTVQLFENGNSIIADVDGDGHNDLVSLDFESQNVVWQKNLGSINTLSTTQRITTGIRENGTLMAVDMEHDGDIDLVFSSDVYDEVLYIENRSGLADFQMPQSIANDVINPAFIAFADLDADGDMDILSGSDEARSFMTVETDLQFEDMIMGRVYNDVDANGEFNPGDHGLKGFVVGLSDGRTTATDNNGFYMFPATPGSFGLSVQEQKDWVLTTGAMSKSVTILAPRSSSLGNDFGYSSKDEQLALEADLANIATRCGLVSPYWVTVTNTGNTKGEVTAQLVMDAGNSYVHAAYEPLVEGNTLTWALGPLQPSEKKSFKVYLSSNESVRNGDVMRDALITRIQSVNGTLEERTDSLVRVVNCEAPAQVMHVTPTGYGAEKAIPWSQSLTYTAAFQNTTGDYVQHVFIEDSLSEWLDISTLEVVSASHDYRMYVKANGVIQFYFENIDLLDAGKDELQSRVFVTYKLKPLSWIPYNTEITNKAYAFFGPEHKLETNEVRNVVGESISLGTQKWEALSETNIVYPNPTHGPTTFDLSNYDYDRVEIHLIDASGRVIFKREMKGGTSHEFQLSALGKGNYLVRALPLETGIAELITKLVIQ